MLSTSTSSLQLEQKAFPLCLANKLTGTYSFGRWSMDASPASPPETSSRQWIKDIDAAILYPYPLAWTQPFEEELFGQTEKYELENDARLRKCTISLYLYK